MSDAPHLPRYKRPKFPLLPHLFLRELPQTSTISDQHRRLVQNLKRWATRKKVWHQKGPKKGNKKKCIFAVKTPNLEQSQKFVAQPYGHTVAPFRNSLLHLVAFSTLVAKFLISGVSQLDA